MPLYIVVPLSQNIEQLRAAAGETLEDFFVLNNGAGLLVSFKGTSVELVHTMGISNPDRSPSKTGPALVTNFSSYYGLGHNDMWEWIKTRVEGMA